MASKNLLKCIPLLETMSKIKDPIKRKMFLTLFEANLRRALQEMCHNLLQGNVDLTPEDKKRLKRFRNALRELANPKTKKGRFRKIVVQSGRGLIPGLIALVSSIVANAI